MITGTEGGMGDVAAGLHFRGWSMRFPAVSAALLLGGAAVQPAEPTLGWCSIEQREDGVIGEETVLAPVARGGAAT